MMKLKLLYFAFVLFSICSTLVLSDKVSNNVVVSYTDRLCIHSLVYWFTSDLKYSVPELEAWIITYSKLVHCIFLFLFDSCFSMISKLMEPLL